MSITVTIKGIPEAQFMLARIAGIPEQVLDDMAAIGHEGMRQGAGRHSPRPTGTGRLYRSLFRSGQGTKRQQVGHSLDDAPHAEHVIFGSIPHEIKPKNAKVLSWIGGIGFNRRVFRSRVWHPGYIGDNYRDRALNDSVARLPDFLSQRMGAL